jgi:hypothetical protein
MLYRSVLCVRAESKGASAVVRLGKKELSSTKLQLKTTPRIPVPHPASKLLYSRILLLQELSVTPDYLLITRHS